MERNSHIKVINGRKYYYESTRKGDTIISKYLGPVEPRVRKEKIKKPEYATIKEGSR